MEIPCKQCLKFAICISKKEVKCKDLVLYINSSKTPLSNLYTSEQFFNKSIIGVSDISYYVSFRRFDDKQPNIARFETLYTLSDKRNICGHDERHIKVVSKHYYNGDKSLR